MDKILSAKKELMTIPALYSRAVHMVTLEGINLFDLKKAGKNIDKIVNEIIADKAQNIKSRPNVEILGINDLPGYGLSIDALSCFKGRGAKKFDMNLNLLRMIWLGLNYTEKGDHKVPSEILGSLNSGEILSVYRAYGKLIRDGFIEYASHKIRREELIKYSAEEFVSKMVGYGCRHDAMEIMNGRGYHEFPTGKGDLIARVSAFTPSIKNELILAAANPRLKTIKEDAGQYELDEPASIVSYQGLPRTASRISLKEFYIGEIAELIGQMPQKNYGITKKYFTKR